MLINLRSTCNLRTSILCDGVTGRNSVEHCSVSCEKDADGCNLKVMVMYTGIEYSNLGTKCFKKKTLYFISCDQISDVDEEAQITGTESLGKKRIRGTHKEYRGPR